MDAAVAASSAIGRQLRIENVAMYEDGEIQGTLEKVIHTEGKMAEDVPTKRLPVSGRGSS